MSLPFEADSGPSFSELVRMHGADVTPRAVLDELLRVNAVRRLKDGRIRPVERAYVPQADDEQKLRKESAFSSDNILCGIRDD